MAEFVMIQHYLDIRSLIPQDWVCFTLSYLLHLLNRRNFQVRHLSELISLIFFD